MTQQNDPTGAKHNSIGNEPIHYNAEYNHPGMTYRMWLIGMAIHHENGSNTMDDGHNAIALADDIIAHLDSETKDDK